MNNESIKAKILEYIHQNVYASFLDIETIFKANNFPYKGTMCIVLSNNPNIVLHTGWNADAVELFADLINDRSIMIKRPTDDHPYHGYWLNYPIAKQRNRKYKTVHWMPVILCKGKEKATI